MTYEPRRLCRKCGERKYELTFRGGQCEDCHVAYHRAWKKSERGKAVIRKLNKKAQRDKRAMCLIAAAKGRARKKGVPFDLSSRERARLQAVIDAGVCELTGLPFKMDNPDAQFCWDSPSLDRIRPSDGYVDGNLRVVLYGMNAALGPWGEETLRMMVQAWLGRDDVKP